MRNLYKVFRDLIPEPALQVGTVLSVSGGVASLELPGGGVLKARGDATTGQRVFVRGGVIEGAAPDLPVELIEI